MANLRRQKEALVAYFEAGCKPQGRMTVGLEVEHFLTSIDGTPASFEQAQAVMQALEDAAPPDESVAAPDDRQSVDQALPCKVGDTVYLEDTPFVITQIGPFNVQLQDLSLRYPILRSESRENFFRLC